MSIPDSPLAVIVCAAHGTFLLRFVHAEKWKPAKEKEMWGKDDGDGMNHPPVTAVSQLWASGERSAAVFGLITFERQSMARDHGGAAAAFVLPRV